MKAATLPHNPLVQAQRPGYCVVSLASDVFLSDAADDSLGLVVWRGARYTWCRPGGPIKVWMSMTLAEEAANKAGGEVVTVPRHNGATLEWLKVRS
jgi:hypothetical protein